MSEQKENEKQVTQDDLIVAYQTGLKKYNEGIAELSPEAQDLMMQKHGEGHAETVRYIINRMYGIDPNTIGIDDMIKHSEMLENQYAKGAAATITREANTITWRSNLSYCYDPYIEYGMIKHYPAYCLGCGKYYFEYLYGPAHGRPVKVDNVKGVNKGDDTCITTIELL